MWPTANAIAKMETLTTRYGPAPRAFVIVPVVGAFLVDLSNAALVTLTAAMLR
jgi:ESS family glutamate:Na+ symporter